MYDKKPIIYQLQTRMHQKDNERIFASPNGGTLIYIYAANFKYKEGRTRVEIFNVDKTVICPINGILSII